MEKSLFVLKNEWSKVKVKVIPQQAEVAQGVPGRLSPRIFLTYGTTRVVARQPYAPAHSSQDKSLVLIFRGWIDPRAHGSVGGSHGKKSPVTPPGIDPGTIRLVAHCLNHYDTPGPNEWSGPWNGISVNCFLNITAGGTDIYHWALKVYCWSKLFLPKFSNVISTSHFPCASQLRAYPLDSRVLRRILTCLLKL
jgi:hypothetical protein